MSSMSSQTCFLECQLSNKDNNINPQDHKYIDNISDFNSYLNRGKFILIIDQKHINELNKKKLTASEYYEKNNNIIIDFKNDEKKALLFMNNSKELENLSINNIFVVNYNVNKYIKHLFNEILSFKNIKDLKENLGEKIVFPIRDFCQLNSKNKEKINYINKSRISNANKPVVKKEKENSVEIIQRKAKKGPDNSSNQNKIKVRQNSAPYKVNIILDADNCAFSKESNNNKLNNKIIDKKLIQIFKKKKNPLIFAEKAMIKQKSNNNFKEKTNFDKNNNIIIETDISNYSTNINKKKEISLKSLGNINNKNESIINQNKPKEQSVNSKLLKQILINDNKNLNKENLRLIKLEQELKLMKLKYIELNREKKELENQNELNKEKDVKLNELNMENNNLKNKINDNQMKMNEKNKEINNLENKIKELQNKSKTFFEKYEKNDISKIKELQKKQEELESKLKVNEIDNAHKESELQTNKKVINLLNIEINQLKEKINIKDNEINKLKKRIKELEELINKKEDNIKKFQKEIGNNNINETESDSIIPTNEYRNIRNSKIIIVAKNKSDFKNEKQIVELEDNIKENNNQLLIKENEIKKLKNDIVKMNQIINSLNSENDELKKELENKKFLLKQKEIEISNLNVKNKELEKNNEKQNKLLNEYQIKINNCINEIENSNKNRDDLLKQINDLQKNDKIKINLSNKEKEINEREKTIKKKEKDLNNRVLFLENKELLLENENQKVEKINLSIQQYLAENNNLKNANDNLIKQNQQLQNEIFNYKQMLLNNQPNNNFQQNNMIPMNQNIILPQNNQQNNIIMNFNNQLINNNNNINNNLNNNNNINNNNTNKNNQIIQKETEPEPIKLYKKPTLIGLNNIGATCFMNATLQCLSQTEALTNYFLKEKNKNKIINNNIAKVNKNENQLSPAYLELIQKLWEVNGPKSFSPNNFMNKINEMNSLFKRGEAGDAKDFIIFILEQMHTELKKSVKQKDNNEVNEEIPLNQYDKMNAFINFFEDFKNETSILTDTFFGFNETTNICLYCKNYYSSKGQSIPICYNYGVFNVLIFPLEEVKNLKLNIMKQNIHMNQINKVNLHECFAFNEKTELFSGENKNYCNICKQLYDSLYTSKIFVSPNVLILILNRGKGNIYKVNLDFEQTIDITDFVIQKEKLRIQYNLYGVITHLGESGPNAHFVASCKSPVDGKWYRYNDAFVNPINDFKKEVHDFGTPYILFYKKV